MARKWTRSRSCLLGMLLVVGVPAASCGGSGGGGGTPTQPDLLVLDTSNQIWRYASSAPGTALGVVGISGLLGAERVVAIDVRPATGELFALAVSANGTGTVARLLVVEPLSGSAVQLGGDIPLAAGVPDAGFGFDFIPNVDRIRVVASTDMHFRLNPVNGSLVTFETPLNPAGGQVEAMAYDRNTPGGLPTDTTIYAIRASTAELVAIGGINQSSNPSNGQLLNPLPLAVGLDATGAVAFDIRGVDEAYAIFDGDTGPLVATALYRISLTTGAATLVGGLGGLSSSRVLGMALR